MSEFARIFSPKTERAVKAISLLTNGPRYKPTEDEIAKTLSVLKEAVNDIAQLYGALPSGKLITPDSTCIAQPPAKGDTSEERIDAAEAVLKRSPFAHGDVDVNVRSIPDNQLTAYATQILHRVCEKWHTPEAKPKVFVPTKTED